MTWFTPTQFACSLITPTQFTCPLITRIQFACPLITPTQFTCPLITPTQFTCPLITPTQFTRPLHGHTINTIHTASDHNSHAWSLVHTSTIHMATRPHHALILAFLGAAAMHTASAFLYAGMSLVCLLSRMRTACIAGWNSWSGQVHWLCCDQLPPRRIGRGHTRRRLSPLHG
jgi:hypothetical protein